MKRIEMSSKKRKKGLESSRRGRQAKKGWYSYHLSPEEEKWNDGTELTFKTIIQEN